MKRAIQSIPVIITGVAFLFFACRHEIPITGNNGGGTGSGGGTGTGTGTGTGGSGSCSLDTVYFAQSVLPLLSSSCAQSGCHNGNSGGDAGDYTLNTYAGILRLVQAGNAGGSTLISVVSRGRMPPRGYTALTASQIALLSKWINQGALNNGCVASVCDTTQVTYSGTIAPIFQTYCTGCHSGSAPSGGGVDLTVYANVVAQANSGKLWGDVSHLNGYNAMPLGGASLSSCDLSKINAWIKAGTPNN